MPPNGDEIRNDLETPTNGIGWRGGPWLPLTVIRNLWGESSRRKRGEEPRSSCSRRVYFDRALFHPRVSTFLSFLLLLFVFFSLFYLFRFENSTMIREEGKWRFRIFSKRWRRERVEYLNIDRNREEALIAGLDRNRISKGVENARVLCVRNGGHTGLFVRIELKI